MKEIPRYSTLHLRNAKASAKKGNRYGKLEILNPMQHWISVVRILGSLSRLDAGNVGNEYVENFENVYQVPRMTMSWN